MAIVPAHCASSVAMAAPLLPMPMLTTQTKSPTQLTTVEVTVATNGVTVSLAPISAAWRTPASNAVGIDNARMATYAVAGSNMELSPGSGPMYTPSNVRPARSSSIINPTPHSRDIFPATRTTPSPAIRLSTESLPLASLRAIAPAYRLVVATFRNANRYVAPSMKVVAGPRAPSCAAPVPGVALSPTLAVSTRDRRGPAIHRARQGT
mmetsp:Transcript_30284/g.66608  ORF Transcript_30284/g.66608 Transcript_30284/m.66608 type:complete len:208 (-) Transcript_30284:224-847(-)